MAKSKIVKANEKIAEKVVGGYKKIENAVVGGYTKIEDKFVDMYLTKDGETVEQAKDALNRPAPAPVKKKKKNAALLYEQTPISEEDFNNLVVNLSEDL